MPTALITGATSGIGLVFARTLAVEGYDLVLVARDTERLESVASEFAGRTVEVLTADLSSAEGREITAERAHRGVDMLVNNAGSSTNHDFDSVPWADEQRILHLNVEAVLQLTHAAVPAMLAAGHGDIINVSSVSGFFPMAGGATYAAEKAFVTTLSEGLSATYAGRGLRIMALCPGFTHTEFHQRIGVSKKGIPARMWLSAEQVVTEGLRDLRRGRAVSVPAVTYKAIVATGRYLPPPLLRAASARVKQRRGRV